MVTTRGLLHMRDVPLIGRSTSIFIETLRVAIRRAADRQGGRNVPLEDKFRGILSWSPLYREGSGIYVVRVAAIRPDGRRMTDAQPTDPDYIQIGLLDTLYNETYRALTKNMRIVLVRDETPTLFKDKYTVTSLDHTDFLYADNWPPHVRNIIVEE